MEAEAASQDEMEVGDANAAGTHLSAEEKAREILEKKSSMRRKKEAEKAALENEDGPPDGKLEKKQSFKLRKSIKGLLDTRKKAKDIAGW